MPTNMADMNLLQSALDLLSHNLGSAGFRVEIEHDLRSYYILRESHRLWHDPAFSSSVATRRPFWLAICDTRQQLLAVGAVRLIETAGFVRTLETGELWREQATSTQTSEDPSQDHRIIDAQLPSRDPAGKISYIQTHILERGRHIAELGWMMSWLTQAMALRLQGSQYTVSMVRSDLRDTTAQRTRESFARSEFCFSGMVPPLRSATTLHLCQTRLEEFLAWAHQISALGYQRLDQGVVSEQPMAFAS